ncbi:MAG: hypothetical protein HUJ71_05700 [Pseudobutyrivibrio sp.]|nr:hypothetical protein [Pseudobutyrivibrio sp.]
MRSEEVKEYRRIILDKICHDDMLIDLLCTKEELKETPEEERYKLIPYKHCFPHDYTPIDESGNFLINRYLNFEIQETVNKYNPTLKDVEVYFFAVCHQTQIKMSTTDLTCWYDEVACIIDDLFGDSNFLGIGKLELVSNEPYRMSYANQIPYKGRTLIFAVKDFTDGKKYGK